MPFAGYKDFDDCVSKNRDKDDPKAYCAVIMRKVEGEHETDHESANKEFEKEKKEHPNLSNNAIWQIVKDHLAKHGKKATLCKFVSHWKKAKMAKYPNPKELLQYPPQPKSTAEHEREPDQSYVSVAKAVSHPAVKTNWAKTIGGYKSPEPGALPKGKAQKLAEVYAAIRKKQKGDTPAEKERAAKIAWSVAKHRKLALARHWKAIKAKHSGVAQIPMDYTKRLDGQDINKARHSKLISHGTIPVVRTARHANFEMKEYAELEVAFLKEGDFRTHGVPYHYSWETIEKDGKTFEGKGFFLNHNEESGLEIGIVDDVYTKDIGGEKWLCASVKIPEAEFAKGFLERVENGLVKYVSSTHDFITDPEDPAHQVKEIRGKALSSVKEGEVEDAKILSIKRHIKNN